MVTETEDGQWMSYAELAEKRGISPRSATRMAFRHRWRRQVANDGTARVFVPASALHGNPHDAAMGVLEDVVAVLREQLDRGEARIAAILQQLEQANSRADREAEGRETERARADAIVEALQVRLTAAGEAVAAERERADRIMERSSGMADQVMQAQVDLAAARTGAEASEEARRRAEELLQAVEASWQADKDRRQAEDTARRSRGVLARLMEALKGN